MLSSFRCDKDADIVDFLRKKAVEFETVSKARTYIVFDDDKLARGEMDIIAYFSVSLKVLILPDEFSIRRRKTYDGYRGAIHGKPIKEVPCYLIGQLAKNSASSQTEYTGTNLLNDAMSIIYNSSDLVGGRYVLIECNPKKKLIAFYEKNGFSQFNEVNIDKDHKLLQLIREI